MRPPVPPPPVRLVVCTVLAAAWAGAAPTRAAPAGAGQPADDGVLATLLTPDGDMRLTLTPHTLRVGFTAQGDRRIRRAADSAFSAAYGPPNGVGPHHVARPAPSDESTVDAPGTRGPKPPPAIPLREVRDARATRDSLVLCFAQRSGVPEPACGAWRRIVVTGLAAADARHFADAVRRARDAETARR